MVTHKKLNRWKLPKNGNFLFQPDMLLIIITFCLTIMVAKSEIVCGVGITSSPSMSIPGMELFNLYKRQCANSSLCSKAIGKSDSPLIQQYELLGGWCNEMTDILPDYHCKVTFFVLVFSLKRRDVQKNIKVFFQKP